MEPETDIVKKEYKPPPDRTRFRIFLAVIGALVSGFYLLNLSCGVFFEIPDNLPIIGNLDEVAVSAFFFGCLSYMGIDLVPFMKRRDKNSDIERK